MDNNSYNSFYLDKGLVSPKVAILLKERHFHEPCNWSLHGGTPNKVITNHNKAKDFNGAEYVHLSTEWISVPYLQDALFWLDDLGICMISIQPLQREEGIQFAFSIITQDGSFYESYSPYWSTRREAMNAALEEALTKLKI